ncbi:MAG TPA: hypothetical protein VLK29_06060 [Luteimonas sp.]|nr:hypothetical protein [Luteimonas sp.]
MHDQDRLSKTERGREEMRSRALKLAPALRSTLLLVDGARSVAQLRQLAVGLHAPGTALEQLAALGLIANPADASTPAAAPAVETPSRFRVLSELCSEAVRQHLGLRGYFMQLRIERCPGEDEIVALLPHMRDAIGKAKGPATAAEWLATASAAAALPDPDAAGAGEHPAVP